MSVCVTMFNVVYVIYQAGNALVRYLYVKSSLRKEISEVYSKQKVTYMCLFLPQVPTVFFDYKTLTFDFSFFPLSIFLNFCCSLINMALMGTPLCYTMDVLILGPTTIRKFTKLLPWALLCSSVIISSASAVTFICTSSLVNKLRATLPPKKLTRRRTEEGQKKESDTSHNWVSICH